MRERVMGKRIIRAILKAILLFAVTIPVPANRARAQPRYETWAFYVPYDATSRTSLLTHLAQIDDVSPEYFSLQKSGAIASQADPVLNAALREAGKGIYPLVKNDATHGDLTAILADPVRRASAVRSIAQLGDSSYYAGLTLDFEGVDGTDRGNLTRFIDDLAGSLHARGKRLVVALPAKTSDSTAGWGGAYDYPTVGQVADRVILMAYAYRTAATSQPGPISPLPWIEDVAQYALSTIPRDKLILGIGVWGYDWNLSAPGHASALRYDQTIERMSAFPGQASFDLADASAEYSYIQNGQNHEIWFENAASIQQKLAVATRDDIAGVAIWRLGEEPAGFWADLNALGAADFPLTNGWYYGETGAGSGLGFRVEDGQQRFWTEFQRYGGVRVLGYPVSRPFVGPGGFTYQAFQRGVLQWRPELGIAYLANTFEQLTTAGQDPALQVQGIPPPVQNDGSGGDWIRARQIRLGWLTNPSIAASFYANPNPDSVPNWTADDAIQLYGLPASQPVKSGPFIVQRFQRISLQLWVEDVPGMPRKGAVVGILGGDLLKRAGLIPSEAATPQGAF